MKNSHSLIGLALIGLAFGMLYFQNKQIQDQQPQVPPPSDSSFLPQEAENQAAQSIEGAESVAEVEDEFIPATVEESFEPGIAAETKEEEKLAFETDLTLRNEFLEVNFTKSGGAIKEISFLQTKRGGRDDYVFNEDSEVTALQLSRRELDGSTKRLNYPYQIISQDNRAVVFEYDTGKGVKFVRSYQLGDPDGEEPYTIRHSTQIINSGNSKPIIVGATENTELLLTLGMALPQQSDRFGDFQSFAYQSFGEKEFVKSKYFIGSKGFFGMGTKAPKSRYLGETDTYDWASVKNQFFVSVFTPESPGSGAYARSVSIPSDPNNPRDAVGIVGEIGFTPGKILPNSDYAINGTYYVGPKEYNRLVQLDRGQDALMQFGFFKEVSKILLTLLYWVQGFVGNWGVSIILMTVIVKGVFWPLTSYSAKSSKKMQLLQEPMKELREKYADKPEKMQRETMALFKKYGVNPLAGCLPMLVQIPIFIGLYWMLRTCSELRYEPFLWIQDLSQPDTVARIGGFPLNIMPLLNGAAMFFQMQLMPMNPSADPNQQRIMKFMPLMFLFFMYSFSSGLVLYWTVQSLLSILQTVLVYRSKKNVELVPVAAPAAPAKPGAKGPARKRKK
ncbi:MAG: membrane protein insertase YidC [Opitutales bacterium]|nr:membrane protein insertase YidC [Opitutales bacterium]